jgi:hypothetical protein
MSSSYLGSTTALAMERSEEVKYEQCTALSALSGFWNNVR